MNQQIQDKYQIKFINKIMDFGSYGKKHAKTLDINIFTLGEFIIDWNHPDEIDELLLSDVNDVLSGKASERDNGSTTISISIMANQVVFYIDHVGTNQLEIPTTDFKEIMEGWRDFLLMPPLND